MEIKTLENTAPEQLTAVFNEAFKSYEISMNLSVDEIVNKIVVENIDLHYSVGVFDEDRLVGFLLHAIDVCNGKKVAWNGGTGVIEAHRGKKLTEKMYDFILPMLKKDDVERIVLEVLKTNEKAKRVYAKLGFKETRELLSYKGFMAGKSDPSHQVELLETYDLDSLSLFEDAKPCWQLSNTVIRNWGDAIVVIGIKKKSEIVGFLVYNKENKRVCRFGVRKDFRRQGLATAMFAYVSKRFDKQITVVNMDGATESVNTFLKGSGLAFFAGQWEMERTL